MGKRSVGVSVWLVIGALVLLTMAPKEVWIGLGVIGGIVLVAYLAIKHLGQKATAHKAFSSRDAHRHEPTLGEWIAANEAQRSVRRPAPPPLLPGRPSRVYEQPLAASLGPVVKSPDQSAEWNAIHQAAIDTNRELAQALRNKFPATPAPARTNERKNAPVHSDPPLSPTALHSAD